MILHIIERKLLLELFIIWILLKNVIDGLDALTQPLAKRNSNENVRFEHITMDLGAFLNSVSGGVYYTYLGSLTTPGR